MTVVDPGHRYALGLLDYGENAITSITFVKRMGPGYPGNLSSYTGTTLQEAMRACHDRTRYLNRQKRSVFNLIVRCCLVVAICALEFRAAVRHRRWLPLHPVKGKTCWKCLHVGCTGNCHTSQSPGEFRGCETLQAKEKELSDVSLLDRIQEAKP